MTEVPVARVFYYELYDADLLKLEGRSNLDPGQGGGARDLRLPNKQFRYFMEKLFPIETEQKEPSSKTDSPIIRSGTFYWYKDGELKDDKICFHPPTPSRPSESRIAIVNQCPPLQEKLPSSFNNRLFLLLIQAHDGKVYPEYIDEDEIRRPASSSEVPTALLGFKG